MAVVKYVTIAWIQQIPATWLKVIFSSRKFQFKVCLSLFTPIGAVYITYNLLALQQPEKYVCLTNGSSEYRW